MSWDGEPWWFEEVCRLMVAETGARAASRPGGVEMLCDPETYDHFWNQDGLAMFGTSERSHNPRIKLWCEDPAVVANWGMLYLMNAVRRKRGFRPIKLPARGGRIAPGWSVEDLDQHMARLVRPDGSPINMAMLMWYPKYVRLWGLSWVADADPAELLASFLDPDGAPLLTEFLSDGSFYGYAWRHWAEEEEEG